MDNVAVDLINGRRVWCMQSNRYVAYQFDMVTLEDM